MRQRRPTHIFVHFQFGAFIGARLGILHHYVPLQKRAPHQDRGADEWADEEDTVCTELYRKNLSALGARAKFLPRGNGD